MTRSSSTGWFVYMVACNDGSLYTGITTDLERRTREHNTGKGAARYTRTRRPVRLAYWEAAKNRSEAARREYRIKNLPAEKKRNLVASFPYSK
jgi:putative endonuclease